MTLRVLVVSDVRIVREGLGSVLAQQREIEVVSTVDVSQAKERSAQLVPDVVLVDVARQDCLGSLQDLVVGAPRSKVVAFGVKDKGEEILALAAAGTAGYVRDSAASGDLVKVLESVMCDELPCSPRAAASLYRRVALLSPQCVDVTEAANSQHPCPVPLTRRELQIAHLVDRGLTNKQIARQLGIEAATVKNHIHNICGKLNVHRRGEAIAQIRVLLQGRSAPLALTPEFPAP
jgi:two-component system, NarL family, nitrate/nitrite response regulator NarL